MAMKCVPLSKSLSREGTRTLRIAVGLVPPCALRTSRVQEKLYSELHLLSNSLFMLRIDPTLADWHFTVPAHSTLSRFPMGQG